jgi:hypothetical protein
VIVIEKSEKLQWDIIEKGKEKLLEWSKENNAHIFTVHFVPIGFSPLEVYIFYENDIDIVQNEKNGVTDNVKRVFLETISDMNYMKIFDDNITFTFDSNENVIKNYQGSYFFRLR